MISISSLMSSNFATLYFFHDCILTFQLWEHIKRPIGLFIGIISQFVIVPLSGYLILTATGITGLHATGVLIISCCPGGVLSNTFTYFCEGDLSLR
ncbi:hypothetical protein AVEN_186734-1 [Araneus ventricosus]|uniref:Uncharacterized protein n=2 Tax=Araneus ventricosus TaxID=182803 RepID=A0A4Y2W7L3_ARAVE|nr:hypothetical protein AVEN_191776-1 [Araneus ventricosus]GBO33398.1 hypothetical protein AVEN_192643-1 [Araneus ventricosus]GBO33412.1 hypothetical protein AVEN_186734-1 [Araneus ventricosus]